MDLSELLELRTWRAFDVDDTGRVLAGWDDSGSVQLVELAPGEAPRVLTALPSGCAGRYLPGERRVVVVHDDGGDERAQLSLLDADRDGPAGLEDLVPLVRDPAHVHALLDVARGRVVYRTNRRNGTDFDVVVRDVSTGVEEVLYDGGGNVTEAAWSPDARYLLLALVGQAPMSAQLVVVDSLATTRDDHVAALTAPDEHSRFETLRWLPGSEQVVLTSDRERDTTGVAVLDVATGSLGWQVTDDRHDLTGWPTPDGERLLVATDDDGWSRLALHRLDGGAEALEVALPSRGVVGYPVPDPVFSPGGTHAALTWSAPGVPMDVALLDLGTGAVTALTSSAPEAELAAPSSHRVPAHDGEAVPCYRYDPTDPPAALAGSSVTIVHGGPEGQSRPTFNPVLQALVAAGHTVLVPNVRGSVGHGKRWYSLDDVGLRMDSVRDLGSLHDWLPGVGLDPARAALWGGSYGGYMVLAGVAFQPERWAAGVDIVGMSSLVTFLENTSDYRRAAREREYGTLEHDRDLLTALSPLTRVQDVRAPLVVIHGANDPRVPLGEAEQLHAALTSRGVECELLVYPDEGHGLAKRANKADAYPRALAFLARHLSR